MEGFVIEWHMNMKNTVLSVSIIGSGACLQMTLGDREPCTIARSYSEALPELVRLVTGCERMARRLINEDIFVPRNRGDPTGCYRLAAVVTRRLPFRKELAEPIGMLRHSSFGPRISFVFPEPAAELQAIFITAATGLH